MNYPAASKRVSDLRQLNEKHITGVELHPTVWHAFMPN